MSYNNDHQRNEEPNEEFNGFNLDRLSSNSSSTNSSNSGSSTSSNTRTRTNLHYTRYNTDQVVGVKAWCALSVIVGGLSLIPIFGPYLSLVLLIVLALAGINKNIQNWARATLIMGAIGLLFYVLILGGIMLS